MKACLRNEPTVVMTPVVQDRYQVQLTMTPAEAKSIKAILDYMDRFSHLTNPCGERGREASACIAKQLEVLSRGGA